MFESIIETTPIPIKMKPATKNIIRESLFDITTINLLMLAGRLNIIFTNSIATITGDINCCLKNRIILLKI
jgi:hypothetical protein